MKYSRKYLLLWTTCFKFKLAYVLDSLYRKIPCLILGDEECANCSSLASLHRLSKEADVKSWLIINFICNIIHVFII